MQNITEQFSVVLTILAEKKAQRDEAAHAKTKLEADFVRDAIPCIQVAIRVFIEVGNFLQEAGHSYQFKKIPAGTTANQVQTGTEFVFFPAGLPQSSKLEYPKLTIRGDIQSQRLVVTTRPVTYEGDVLEAAPEEMICAAVTREWIAGKISTLLNASVSNWD